MKNLNEYIKESLLDDFDELDKDVQQNAIKTNVWKFLTDNYRLNSKTIGPDDENIKISDEPNKDGKYIVDVNGNIDIKNHDIYTLTNDLFVLGKVDGYFDCSDCKNLKSLEGAPEKVGTFYCSDCKNLTSLKGAPKAVGGNFYCAKCNNLTSLEGAPKKVGSGFYCSKCNNLTSLEGAPKAVGGNFSCSGCENLTSLKGAPEKVGRIFDCSDCNKLKNLDYLPKKIKGSLDVPDHLKNK